MEEKEKGPVCKRTSGKRRRHPSSHSQLNLQSSVACEHDDASKTDPTEICKPSSFNVSDEFDKFNESDLLLAEIDIETVSSTFLKGSVLSPAIKKKCPHVMQMQYNGSDEVKVCQQTAHTAQYDVVDENQCNTSSILANKTVCASDHTEASIMPAAEASSSDEDLFDDNFHQLNDINSSIHVQTFNTGINTSTKKAKDGSLSEYFFIDTKNNSSSKSNNPSDELTCDIHQSAIELKLPDLTNPNISSTRVESVDHPISNVLANTTYIEEESSTLGIPSTVGKTLVLKNESLKEKMKTRLKQNAGNVSVQINVEDFRKEVILQAKIDASQIRKEGTKVDIGPFFGLPVKVQQLFETHRGITKFYDWQNECLNLQAVRERKNLIYTLPTSGGKTLVAEVLIMRELLCYEKDALLVLPFVSIVQEKVKTISEFATELGFIVEEYAGSKGRFPPTKRQKKKSLYVATIEKANSLVNSLIETDRKESLGLVVVDELHMIGEGGSRGATLESMLLKLVFMYKTQIIGMSATLSNIKDLQDFLHAEHFTNNFRPVTLKEYVKVEDNMFSINHEVLDEDKKLEHEKVISFPYSSELLRQDPDHLLGLVMEIIPDNSCLMFCATKKHCENVALMLSKLGFSYYRHLASIKEDKRKQLLKELYQDGEGKICPVLKNTVQFGIAYHHSGLTTDERHLIEDAYSEGTLSLLTCTSTLAAGVNLPAKRVILRSPYIGLSFIKYSQYKQMTGRAGRAGIDTSGESILIIKSHDKTKVKNLLAGPKDLCHSSLASDGMKGIKSLLLSAIGLKIVTSAKAAFEFMNMSLFHIQASALDIDVTIATRESLQYLIDQKLIISSKDGQLDDSDSQNCLCVSSLGQATFKGSVDHINSSQLYMDLKAAEVSLNLATHLHLLYLVTPYDVVVNIDWRIYLNQFSRLNEAELKVASLIGVPESYIGLRAAGHSTKKKLSEMTVKRFYLTLMLWDMWNQRSVWEVAEKFLQPRGFVQNLLSQSVAFASSVFHFCQELEEFWAYQDLFSNFIKRLAYCVSSELIPLMEVPGVKLARAKQLYAAGYKSLSMLAGAEGAELVNAIEYMSLRAARQIIASAKNILEEKTAALLEEVESLVPVPHSTP